MTSNALWNVHLLPRNLLRAFSSVRKAEARKRRTRIDVGNLPDHILRDIGLPETMRNAIRANREVGQARLRGQADGGPFFIPPA